LLLPAVLHAGDPVDKKLNKKIEQIAGKAEFLRRVPKHFATLKAVDAAVRRVTLRIEGDVLDKVWPLTPDAEVKVAGWWGRLDQLTAGDRVWVWFKTDRQKQAVAVAMIADEPSEQDMHDPGVTLEAKTPADVTVKPVASTGAKAPKVKSRTLTTARLKDLDRFPVGGHLYVQSAGDRARAVWDAEAFEKQRLEQKLLLRQRWEKEGLPGAVAFVHVFGGEMDYMLDHEAMRWGRSLQPGDKVTLQAQPPINAVVKHVQPWRERTQLRLVVHAFDLADLEPGQRLLLKMTPPPAEVDTAQLPPDLDRPRTRAERIEWFLASIYCTCKIGGDGCTGHFYTLASCNPNGCGMPNHMRRTLAEMIDRGLTDRQIFEELLKEHGPELLRPHLLP
jgi:hypothetical protein